jgi:choline dehydrogenase
MTSRGGRRVTTADAYLPLGATPANLAIRADAQIAEVVFDGTSARGVRLLDGEVVEAGHVVLCAGTSGSPPILMRSGIGPADDLRALGIEVRADLPGVGANLADHPALALDAGYRGPMRDEPILHHITTFHSSQPQDAAPDLMLWCSDPEEPSLFEIAVVLLRPLSRGRVGLRSADPADPPRIELPALADPVDVERLVEGFARAVEVANHGALRRHCEDAATPVPSGQPLPALVLDEAFSLPHVVGTCAMGPRPEDGAVVDAAGRVHGTESLTIVDASVMPDVPSGFTHFPTIMIAERLAELLARSR